MPGYDATRYDPPAPVAIVGLRRLGGGGVVRDVPLLIDTGADVTLLPRSAVTRLGVTPVPDMRYELIGFDGARSTADAVELEMLFLNKAFRGRYLLTEDDHGILGRDVLASLGLTFDGPAQVWSELTDGP
jgi:predicted aspartyl protease